MASTSNATELEAVPLPQELQTLTALLDDNILAFAVGDKAIEDAALIAAKYLFDLGEFTFLRRDNKLPAHI